MLPTENDLIWLAEWWLESSTDGVVVPTPAHLAEWQYSAYGPGTRWNYESNEAVSWAVLLEWAFLYL